MGSTRIRMLQTLKKLSGFAFWGFFISVFSILNPLDPLASVSSKTYCIMNTMGVSLLIKAVLKCSDYEGISLDLFCTHVKYWILLLHAVLHVAYAQQKSSKMQECVSLCVLVCVCVCACWEGLKGGIQYNYYT